MSLWDSGRQEANAARASSQSAHRTAHPASVISGCWGVTSDPTEVMFHLAEQRPKIDWLPTRVLGLPQSLEARGQPRDADKALLGSLLQQDGGAQVTGALAHSLRGRAGSFLYEAWVRVGDRWVRVA